MPRPKKVIPSIEKKINIAADLCTRMELELFSTVENKIPYGAQSELINRLIREHYQRIDAAALQALAVQRASMEKNFFPAGGFCE